MDNAAYLYFNNRSRLGYEERHLGGILGAHIDDFGRQHEEGSS